MKRIEILMAHFGNPQDSLRYIHIAGTNGKGSVSLKTAVALEKVGMKVGLFTSPHLTCFRERFVVNRQLMSEERCVELLEKVLGAVKENSFIVTTFEILFCISILHFKEEQVDYVVLECGIGGKWDTTNIIKTSAVSALTSVGLDHTELLGDTLEKIASDKADIAREGVPFICGRVVPHQVVQEIVEAKGATFIKATPEEVGEDRFFMDDNHDVVKALLKALKEREGLAITDQIVEESLAINQKCRVERVPIEYLEQINAKVGSVFLDVSHNAPAIEKVFSGIQKRNPQKALRAVCGFGKLKDSSAMLNYLLGCCKAIHLVSKPGCKLAKIEDIENNASIEAQKLAKHDVLQNLQGGGDINETLKKVFEQNLEDEVVVICGSFYIMEDVREFFGFQEPRDPKHE